MLYPSWIEIPVTDLARALAFYRAVFALSDTPLYDEPSTRIALLLASEKHERAPGVSLVQSPAHTPGAGGPLVNFHLGDHGGLAAALQAVEANGGTLVAAPVDEGDGQRYAIVADSEGNRLALSSYEPSENA
jgi:hypothetical protein